MKKLFLILFLSTVHHVFAMHGPNLADVDEELSIVEHAGKEAQATAESTIGESTSIGVGDRSVDEYCRKLFEASDDLTAKWFAREQALASMKVACAPQPVSRIVGKKIALIVKSSYKAGWEYVVTLEDGSVITASFLNGIKTARKLSKKWSDPTIFLDASEYDRIEQIYRHNNGINKMGQEDDSIGDEVQGGDIESDYDWVERIYKHKNVINKMRQEEDGMGDEVQGGGIEEVD